MLKTSCRCRWCGEVYPAGAEVDVDNGGFFCEMCDGFTYFSDEDNDRHRMLLLLESGGAAKEALRTGAAAPLTLRKRVSPLRYPGGKSHVIDQLFERMQDENLDTFVEVFAGGASLGLSLLDAGIIKKLVLNDIDPLVYSFWKTVLDDPAPILEKLRGPSPTLEDFWAAKRFAAGYTAFEAARCADAAWSFFFLNRTCYSGIIKAHPLGGKHDGGEKFLSRWNPPALEKRILRVHSLRGNIELHAIDCCELLESIAYWYPAATLFVDPPYVAKGDALYTSSFAEEDHRRLAEMLNALYTGFGGPDIIITYDDTPLIRELYPLADVEPLRRAYSIAK